MRTPKLPVHGHPVRRAWNLVTRGHVWLYKKTGGRGTSRYLHGTRMLLLEHTGRKSGRTFTTPLVYAVEDGAYVIVGSSGASDDDPQWVKNLRANPRTQVVVGRNRHDVTAHVASAEEKASLWPRLVAHNPEWGGYAERTTRDIPVIVLRPV